MNEAFKLLAISMTAEPLLFTRTETLWGIPERKDKREKWLMADDCYSPPPPQDRMLVHRRANRSSLLGSSYQFARTHLYIWVRAYRGAKFLL